MSPASNYQAAERLTNPSQRILDVSKKALKKLGVIGLMGVAAYGVIGSPGDTLDKQGAIERVKKVYTDQFNHKSPSAKFYMQYLASSSFYIHGYKGDWGILSVPSVGGYDISINNACLKGTSYDVYSGGGSTTSTASVNEANPDVLEIANPSNLHRLTFTGLESDKGILTPADSFTKQTLQTYGCHTGTTSFEHTSGGTQYPGIAQTVSYN